MRKLFFWVLLPILALSCSKDGGDTYAPGEGNGTLTISAMTDGEINEVPGLFSRALTAEGFLYTIDGPDGFEDKSGTIGAEPIRETVPAGRYTVNIFSVEDYETELPAFDLPVYGATETQIVAKNATARFNMICRQINTGIRFVFDQSVLDYYGDGLVATITKEANASETMPYAMTDTDKIAYFMPGNVTLTLKDGEQVIPIHGESSKTLAFKAKELWTVTFKTSLSSNGNIVIGVDVDTEVDEQNPEFNIGEVIGSGTEADPYSIADVINVMPAEGVWVKGVIAGTTTITTRTYAADNILIGMEVNSPASQCVVIRLEEGSELHEKLNLVSHPNYLGKTVMLKCDVTDDDGFDSDAFAVLKNVDVDVSRVNITLSEAAPFKIGVAIEPKYLEESDYTATVLKDFNSVSPENALKWNRIARNGRDVSLWDWSEADDYVDFAMENNLRIHGHAILWYAYPPAWVKTLSGDNSFTRENWITLMQDVVKTVVGRYKDQIASWDIVNEAWDDPKNGSVGFYIGDANTDFYNVWADMIGPDYIKLAYQAAREADPNCILFYNDHLLMYGDEAGHTGRTDVIYDFIKEVNNDVQLIDGIGIQFHGHRWYPADGLLKYAVEEAAKTGLQVHISEVSIRLNEPSDYTSYTEAAAAEQSGRYESVFQHYMQYVPAEQQYGITIWGVTDKYSFQRLEGKTDWPLLFDDNYKAKEPYYVILDVLTK